MLMQLRRSHLLTLAFTAGAALFSCSGTQGIDPLPNGFQGERSDSAAAARVTAHGFEMLNTAAPSLLDILAPDGGLNVPLNCSVMDVPVLGKLAVADQGGENCTSETCGQLDGKCTAADVPKQISVQLDGLSFKPKAPNLVEATAKLKLSTQGKIMLASSTSSILCLLQDQLKLSVDVDTAKTAPDNISMSADVRFTLDTRWWKLLNFELAPLRGIQACGVPGSDPPPKCLETNDMEIRSENSCSNWLGTVANINIIKDVVLTLLNDTIQKEINKNIGKANCQTCDSTGQCPLQSSTVFSSCHFSDASATKGTCIDDTAKRCVPRVLGLENRIDINQLLEGNAPAALDVLLAAGGAVTSSAQGLTLGFTGGAHAVITSPCVKTLPEPNLPVLALPDLDSASPGPFDVGISLSQQMVTHLLWQAHQSGAFCRDIGTETISLLDSSLLATVVPSVKLFTQGQTTPARVVVRPTEPPSASIGSGKQNEALVTLKWNDLEVDLYVLVEGRLTRLFTLSFDVDLPLNIALSGCATLKPVVGDLSKVITDVHAFNNEMLAEPLDAIEKLIPSITNLAAPAITDALASFDGLTLPEVGDFKLKIVSIQGFQNIPNTSSYQHIAVYTELSPPGQTCNPMR